MISTFEDILMYYSQTFSVKPINGTSLDRAQLAASLSFFFNNTRVHQGLLNARKA